MCSLHHNFPWCRARTEFFPERQHVRDRETSLNTPRHDTSPCTPSPAGAHSDTANWTEMAEVWHPRIGPAACGCIDNHDHEELECLGKWPNRAGDGRRVRARRSHTA